MLEEAVCGLEQGDALVDLGAMGGGLGQLLIAAAHAQFSDLFEGQAGTLQGSDDAGLVECLGGVVAVP